MIAMTQQVKSIIERILRLKEEQDIAAAIEWQGDPTELVRHLVECGWPDRVPQPGASDPG